MTDVPIIDVHDIVIHGEESELNHMAYWLQNRLGYFPGCHAEYITSNGRTKFYSIPGKVVDEFRDEWQKTCYTDIAARRDDEFYQDLPGHKQLFYGYSPHFSCHARRELDGRTSEWNQYLSGVVNMTGKGRRIMDWLDVNKRKHFLPKPEFKAWCLENLGYMPSIQTSNPRRMNTSDMRFHVFIICKNSDDAALVKFKWC